MHEANKAIKRTRHVTPTLEELTADLNGATTFSKIDLRSGYHQLVLDKESRSITTFSTHVGLFRYKRLIFGVNSAAEVFQHTIQAVISGTKNARNISDEFYGHVFSSDGLYPDPRKIDCLKKTEEPKDSTEVRLFLGMAQYSARFIPNYATLTADLRELTKKT